MEKKIVFAVVCEKWFKRFKNDNYDKLCYDCSNKIKNDELETLFNENSANANIKRGNLKLMNQSSI